MSAAPLLGLAPGAAAGSAAPGRARRLRAPLAVVGAVGAATALLAVRSPYAPGSYGFCPIRAVTGLWCPGCGGLRAVHDLAHLDLAGAWAMNPLVVVSVPVVALLWLVWTVRSWRGTPPRGTGLPGTLALAVVLVAFMVARNVPALAPALAP